MAAFDPKTNKFPYTEDTDKHYLHVKKDNGNVYDTKYPYIDNSKKYRFKKFWFNIALFLVIPIIRVRLNLRVKGKKNLKKYKDVIKGGIISVCNHVHMWDYLGIISVLFPRETHILSWDKNISGENGKMIRMVGGIPVPSNGNVRATATCISQTSKMIKDGGWLHLYPEGSMWEFYQPIRPFKPGASYYALKCNRPVLPMAYSYRPNGWLRKLFKSPASYTLNIGEPIYPDMTLDFKEAEDKLTVELHDAVCKLAGIDPKENIYPPIFNNNKRIDYYTTEYGVGYKKSW